MNVAVVEPPTRFIHWEEVKAALRLSSDHDFELGERLVDAAVAWLDGPAGWLGRCLGQQTLELTDWGFGNNALPYGPVVSIESITYRTGSGSMQELPGDKYRLLRTGGLAALPAGTAWPSLAYDPEAVSIRYVAGYPDAEGGRRTVPEAIVQAVLLIVGHWYRNREDVVTGTIATQLPMAAEALLSPYRLWRF